MKKIMSFLVVLAIFGTASAASAESIFTFGKKDKKAKEISTAAKKVEKTADKTPAKPLTYKKSSLLSVKKYEPGSEEAEALKEGGAGPRIERAPELPTQRPMQNPNQNLARPAQNPNIAVPRAVQNPNTLIVRAPEKPSRRD